MRLPVSLYFLFLTSINDIEKKKKKRKKRHFAAQPFLLKHKYVFLQFGPKLLVQTSAKHAFSVITVVFLVFSFHIKWLFLIKKEESSIYYIYWHIAIKNECNSAYWILQLQSSRSVGHSYQCSQSEHLSPISENFEQIPEKTPSFPVTDHLFWLNSPNVNKENSIFSRRKGSKALTGRSDLSRLGFSRLDQELSTQ